MLIRSACGVKQARPFDDFPEHQTGKRRRVSNPSAEQVRQNFKAYIAAQEAAKNNG